MVSNLNDKKDKSKFAEFKRSFILKVKSISMIPFILGKATFLKIYLTYHPDSHIQHNAHPEFKKLLNSIAGRYANVDVTMGYVKGTGGVNIGNPNQSQFGRFNSFSFSYT